MPDKTASPDTQSDVSAAPSSASPPPPPKRGPGHRGAEVKDTVAEMAAKAHEISLEAGSRMAAAMKDVVKAAAGLSEFVLESARDLVQYMVRRGQMTQEEADKLIRLAEESHASRPKSAAPKAPAAPATTAANSVSAPEDDEPPAPVEKPAAKTAKKTATKSSEKPDTSADPEDPEPVTEKPAAKKTTKTAAKKTTAKKK